MGLIADNLRHLRAEIAAVARACGREPESVELMAVSKTFPASVVDEARQAGQTLFGENRVQEAEAKIPATVSRDLRWHLIGHLQSNKARRAVELFDCIQSLDSEKIVSRLGRAAAELKKDLAVFVQVNIGDEPQKHGVEPDQIGAVVEMVDSSAHLKLRGLMAIPPFHVDPRPFFRRLRELQEQCNRGREKPLDELSMGMSGDWRIAIEEGATLIRVGTSIFGSRG